MTNHGTLSEELRQLIPILRRWAQLHPQIGRVWLYGSRVRGTHRPDSDLDVAVAVARPLETDAAKSLFQELLANGSRDLTAACGIKVSVQAVATPGVDAGVEHGGVIVYQALND